MAIDTEAHDTGSFQCSRRTFCLGTGTSILAGTLITVFGLSACTRKDDINDKYSDPVQAAAMLTILIVDAIADVALAQYGSQRSPAYADQLEQIAEERKTHKQALIRELHRIDATAPIPHNSALMHPQSAPETVINDLRTALTAHIATAREATVHSPGYLSALCGSIAAAMTAHVQVYLT